MSHSDLTAATTTTDDNASVPTLLYDGTGRNGSIRCGQCQRDNHETRLMCTRCGHGLGVPLAECVCETCLHAGEVRE